MEQELTFVISIVSGKKNTLLEAKYIFCQIDIGEVRYLTKKSLNQKLITWDEVFQFPWDIVSKYESIHIQCYGDDVLIGKCDIPIKKLNDFKLVKPKWNHLSHLDNSIELLIKYGSALIKNESKLSDHTKNLDDFQKEIEHISEDSLDSVNKSLEVLKNTLDIGSSVITELDEQNIKLQSAQENIDEIHYDLDYATRDIKSASSIFSYIRNKFRRNPKRKNTNQATKKIIQRKIKKEDTKTDTIISKQDSIPDSVFITEKTRENCVKINKKMDEMVPILDTLKSQSIEIGKQIDESKIRIEIISEESDKSDTRISNAIYDIKKITH